MFSTYLRAVKGFNRNVLLCLLASGLLGMTVDGGIYSVIFNLYLVRLEFGPEFIGQVNAAGLMTFAVASLPAGAIGGRWGCRRTMLTGISMALVGACMVPLAATIAPAAPGGWILASYVTLYLGFALYYVNLAPFMIEFARGEEHNHIFSMQMALMSLAGFTGSLIGGYLPRLYATLLDVSQNQPAPYRFPLFFSALLMIPALLAIFRTQSAPPVETAQPLDEQPAHTHVETPAQPGQVWMSAGGSIVVLLLWLSAVRFLQVAGVATTNTYFNVYLDTQLHVATMHIGMLAAAGRLCAMLAALVTPELVARWGAPRLVVWASWATALSFLPLALVPVWQAAGLGFIGVVVFSSIRYPAFLSFSMELVPPRWRAVMSGASETAGGLSFASMALVGGYLSASQGFSALFLLAAFVLSLGTLLFWVLFAWPRRKRVVATVAESV